MQINACFTYNFSEIVHYNRNMLNRKHKPWILRQLFATLAKIDKYIKFNNEVEKHTWSWNKNLMDASLWEGNLLQYAWYTSAILKHVKLLGLAEQNRGYLTSLHRIRSDKISDKERRVRKFPTFEMATMLWRHMVIKFDNDPGLTALGLVSWPFRSYWFLP